MRQQLSRGDVAFQNFPAAGTQLVILFRQNQFADLEQFVFGIIRKINVMSDARAKTWIAAEEFLHAIGVTRENDDQVFALVFHYLQQNLDGFLPVVSLVLGPVKIIGLINEQHAP